MFQGQRDVPALVLDDGLVSPLPHNGPRRVFSSPLGRALTAAEVLFPGEPVTTDDLLLERSVGEWEGLSHDEVRSRWPEYVVDGLIDLHRTPPGGESLTALLERCWRFLSALPTDPPAYVFTHNGWVRGAMLLTGEVATSDLFATPVPLLTPLPLDLESLAHPKDLGL